MKRAALVIVLSLSACSRGTAPCTTIVRAACDDDGGPSCAAHQTCVSTYDAIDPCPTGAAGCCFQVCSQDSDCPKNQACTVGYCALGACVD